MSNDFDNQKPRRETGARPTGTSRPANGSPAAGSGTAPKRRTAPASSARPASSKARPSASAPRERSASNEYTQSPAYAARQERIRQAQAKRRRKVMMVRAAILAMGILLVLLIAALVITVTKQGQSNKKANTSGIVQTGKEQTQSVDKAADPAADAADAAKEDGDAQPVDEASGEEPLPVAEETESENQSASADVLSQAAYLAAGYDYDGAIALLESSDEYSSNPEFAAAADSYRTQKSACVPVDPNTVPHIFYHSLVNDPARAFNVERLGQFAVDGMNAWMTTIEEFDAITQALYDNGYVYVKLRDLVKETKNADGSVTFTQNDQLLLPEGKKAIVLSIDDLSYYHSYEPAGYPEKLVLDENGLVKCKYTDANGNTTLGDYDVVPRLNTFLREHPDGAYHGARGLIAMTGYDGVFGYRTDADYEYRNNLMSDQAQWLAEHPDFDRQKEIEEATVIANAIKAEGWEFASHTWGHLSVTQASAEGLMNDNQKWMDNVGNIVGPVDTIIFAHGNDIGDWTDYSSSNEKFAALKAAGYDFYCNVDGSVPYWVQIRSNYVRQGRINLDGYMLYQASQGATTVLDNLFTASTVFDSRRPTPVVANGQG
ncbi:MAG: polysaccharide deacetylase [Lachnospiraceae bacterium]|nr:polysaccharide deacetylase [Lachnospiraceae bacterium]